MGPNYPGLQIFFLNTVASALIGFVVVLLTSNVKILAFTGLGCTLQEVCYS